MPGTLGTPHGAAPKMRPSRQGQFFNAPHSPCGAAPGSCSFQEHFRVTGIQ